MSADDNNGYGDTVEICSECGSADVYVTNVRADSGSTADRFYCSDCGHKMRQPEVRQRQSSTGFREGSLLRKLDEMDPDDFPP